MQILPLFLAEENPPEPVDILKTKGPYSAFNSAEVLYKVRCEELTLSWGQRASCLSGFSITGLEDLQIHTSGNLNQMGRGLLGGFTFQPLCCSYAVKCLCWELF